MKIDLISNINMESIKFFLKKHTLSLGCSFGNFFIDILDRNSQLYNNDSDAIFCFLDFKELNINIDELIEALDKLKKTNKIIILNTFYTPLKNIDTFLYQTLEKENEYNLKLIKYAKKNNILLLDTNALIKSAGNCNFFDEKYWYIGKIKLSSIGFKLVANQLEWLLKKYKQSSKKCLVLDLDNTLWGGVIGEGQIELSNEGEGSIYQEFQKNIKALKKFGVLLAINSKNNIQDALQGLEHSGSILKKDDFIIIKANWENKDTNLINIASELNIGEDSLVFIDDNPAERELVASNTKAIVPDFPINLSELNTWFIEEVVQNYFYKFNLTLEDSSKQEQYVAQIKRNKAAIGLNYKEFLNTLDIKIDFKVDDICDIQRYAQLTQKTNQFNLTTKRYTIEDIEKFINSDDHIVIGVNYQDKYAKEGIIGLSIIKLEDTRAIIDTLLLSCRVLKRDVEHSIIKFIENIIPKNLNIVGIYKPTEKNIIVANIYTDLGFTAIDKYTYCKER